MLRYLILGSNEHRAASLRLAVQRLTMQFEVLACAAGRRTRARAGAGTPDYINGGILLRSGLAVEELVQRLHAIEDEAGRVRGGMQCRLDIDLLASEDGVGGQRVHKPEDLRRDYVRALLAELGWNAHP